MARKRLTKRIEDLYDAIGKPEPHPGYFKGELVNILDTVEKLENGTAIREAEAKIAAKESALEKSDAELGKLKGELKALNTEVETFRAEQKEREKKDADLPNEQVELLRILQPKSLGMMQLSEILESISLREDEAVWHLCQLQKLNLADFSHHSIGYEMWYRTELGNAQVIARRIADRGDLPDIAEKILAELSPPGRAPGRADLTAAGIAFLLSITEDLALSYLERLRGAGFAIRTYTSKGTFWSRHPDGTAYLEGKRSAGETDKPYKHDDLPEEQHEVLVMIAEATGQGTIDEGEIGQRLGKSPAFARYILGLLRDAGMATNEDEQPGNGVVSGEFDWSPWRLLRKGEEYLAERGKL